MPTETEKIRDQVIVFLLFLTSEKSLKVCHKFVSPEKLAFELARIWFDEIYVPGIRYLEGGLKGDYSEEAVDEFEDSFTDDELDALERFHLFFELRLQMIPDSSIKTGIWPQNESWRNIIKDAGHLLQALEPDAESKRTRLAGIVKERLTGKSNLLDEKNLTDLFIRGEIGRKIKD